MAEESEKRFHSVMDKLFYAPKRPKSQSNSDKSNSLSGLQGSRGQKRPNMASAFSMVELKSRGSIAEQSQTSLVSSGAAQAPLCRPWDRSDLQKRLATFKSMTWFAKPEVVSAVNCARRGWVNVDSDIIACEACGSRLLFSTPSSWTQNQVEKAAKVFSLKLDNGHKIFCPWVDNVCDEALAQFPPMTAALLVDEYKKRCAALLQLSALPVISSSAISFLKSPQLDDFLRESSNIGFISKSDDASLTEFLDRECQAVSSPYYQALKLVSLCGWESRLVPYFVSYDVREDVSSKDIILPGPSSVVCTEESLCAEGISEPSEELRVTNNPMAITYDLTASSKQYDPSSIVLDCRLCGASVGLWAFSTSPRPIEFIRLVGEVNDANNDGHHKKVNHTDNVDSVTTYNLGNEKQAAASKTANDTSTTGTRLQIELPSSLNLTIAGGPSPAKQNFLPTISYPVIGRNLRARFSSEFESRPGDGQCNDTNTEPLPHLVSEISEQCHTPRGQNNCNMLLGSSTNEMNPEIESSGSVTKKQLQNIPNLTQSSSELLMSEDAAALKSGSAKEDLCPAQIGDSNLSTTVGNMSSANKESSMDDTLMMVAYARNTTNNEIVCSKQGYSQDGQGMETRLESPNSNMSKGLDIKKTPVLKRMEFDPIRQHRHFCPWITSSGSSPPGWKQTLSALQRQKEFSSPSSTHSPSSSVLEVDDPVASIKKLFTSPSPKRAKRTDNSS